MNGFYREREELTKDDFLAISHSGDETAITRAIMDAVYSIDDYDWLITIFKEMLKANTSTWVIGTTLVAIGELALEHKRTDGHVLTTIVQPYLSISETSDWAKNAMSDIVIARPIH